MWCDVSWCCAADGQTDGLTLLLYLAAVCCLDRFYDRYTTIGKFGDYLADASLPLHQAISAQESCTQLDQPPSNYTNALLNTKLDFVNETFARMSRSHSRIDTTPTRGYQDILLYLALEDVENFAAVKTKLTAGNNDIGNRLRFFVGMAHIKTLRSNRLAVSASQVEINADITTAYVYTTKTSTDFTFIRDVGVQLREVKRPTTNGSIATAKFATITIIVPETLSSTDAINIIPPLSLHVGVGYTASSVSQRVYPCTELYVGDGKTALDAMLLEQDNCALQDPICAAQGPVAIGPGGSIQFTFPLEDSTWTEEMLNEDSSLQKSLYINFMVSALNQDGQRLITNLKTSTVLKRTSILSMCTDPELLESSIAEILTVDIFLGLVGHESEFDTSLVQSLDVTKRGPENLRRDISSTASNVMTVLVKGQPDMFEENFARDYTLAVEDIITLHFLSQTKLAEVQALIDAGTAFRQVRGIGTELSTMHLLPSDELLLLCPMQPIPNRYGCVARREVTKRRIEFESSSIVNIAPNDASDLSNVSTKAGVWTSNLLGRSEFARELGFNHSNIMNSKFNLNARYRRGFMISPTTPWRQAEMEEAEITTPLDLAQITITTMLMSLDANINEAYESTVDGGAPHVSNYVPARQLLSSAPSASRSVARMLLQLNSDVNPTGAPPIPNRFTSPTSTREITSVHDNDNVVKAVCGNDATSNKCSMIQMKKRVSIAEFCQGEEVIIQGQQASIDVAMQRASDNALQQVHITSVSQQDKQNICNPPPGRRLLAATTQDLIFTLVLEVRAMVDAFSISSHSLSGQKITAIQGLTNDTFWRLCDNGMVTGDCVKSIALEYNTTRDIVVPFSIFLPDPGNNPPDMTEIKRIIGAAYADNTRIAISAPIHVEGSSTTQFQVTISVPFLQEYGDVFVAAAKHALVDEGFHPENTLQTNIVLEMRHGDVNETVLQEFKTATAAAYGVDVNSVKLTLLPDTFSDQTTVSVAIRTLYNKTDVEYAVEFTMILQMTEAEFMPLQADYVDAISTAAGVSADKVSVGTIKTQSTTIRRLLAPEIIVPISIAASSKPGGDLLALAMSVNALNAALSMKNLQTTTLLKEASTSSAVSSTAQQRDINMANKLDKALVTMDLKKPADTILYIEAAVTVDGEVHNDNSHIVILLYILLAFAVLLMIALLVWARRRFRALQDTKPGVQYDQMHHDESPVIAMDPSNMYPMMHADYPGFNHYR